MRRLWLIIGILLLITGLTSIVILTSFYNMIDESKIPNDVNKTKKLKKNNNFYMPLYILVRDCIRCWLKWHKNVCV
jgi:hypothetical protein